MLPELGQVQLRHRSHISIGEILILSDLIFSFPYLLIASSNAIGTRESESEKGTNKIKVHWKLHPITLSQLWSIEASDSINIFTDWKEQTDYCHNVSHSCVMARSALLITFTIVFIKQCSNILFPSMTHSGQARYQNSPWLNGMERTIHFITLMFLVVTGGEVMFINYTHQSCTLWSKNCIYCQCKIKRDRQGAFHFWSHIH